MLLALGRDFATGLIIIFPAESCLAILSWMPFSNLDATTVLDLGFAAALPLLPSGPFFIPH